MRTPASKTRDLDAIEARARRTADEVVGGARFVAADALALVAVVRTLRAERDATTRVADAAARDRIAMLLDTRATELAARGDDRCAHVLREVEAQLKGNACIPLEVRDAMAAKRAPSDATARVVAAARAERAAVRATIECAANGTDAHPRGSKAWLCECSRLDMLALEASNELDIALKALDDQRGRGETSAGVGSRGPIAKPATAAAAPVFFSSTDDDNARRWEIAEQRMYTMVQERDAERLRAARMRAALAWAAKRCEQNYDAAYVGRELRVTLAADDATTTPTTTTSPTRLAAHIEASQNSERWVWRIDDVPDGVVRETLGTWGGDEHHAIAEALSQLPSPSDGIWRVDVHVPVGDVWTPRRAANASED